MPDRRLTQLPVLAALSADDIFYVVDDPAGAANSRQVAASVFDARYLQTANNLSDLTNVVVARASLGLGTLAVINSPLPIINGGSGQVTQQAAIDALTNVAAATNEHVLTKDTATGNAIFKAGAAALPVVDETAIVFETGVPANTLTFNVTPYTAARVVTWPDADMTIAGLEVANVFTAIQKINVNSALALLVEQDGVKDNTFIVDTANGRTGYGVAPAVEFEMGYAAVAPKIKMTGYSSTRDNAAPRMIFRKSHTDTLGTLTETIASEELVRWDFNGIDTNGAERTGAQFRCLQEGAAGANYINASMFFTAGSSGTLVEVLRFKGDSLIVNQNSVSGLNFVCKGAVDANVLRVNAATDRVSSGIATAATKIHVVDTTATTNAIVNVATLGTNVTGAGVGAAGLGPGLLFTAESSTTVDTSMGRLTYEWATATHATRKALGKLTAFDAATEREAMQWGVDGSNPTLGFLGATRIARPASYTLASTATRTMPTPEAAFTGIDNAQVGAVYAQVADLLTLQTRLNNVEGVLRQVIIDLASTSGFGLLAAA